MTGALRTTAKNPVAIAMMGLLILVFLILGVGGGGRLSDILGGAHGDAVVAAGSHSMSARNFQKVFDQNRQHFEEQSKQQVTTEFLVKNGADQQLLSEIADDEAETEMLARAGINPDSSLVDNEIKKLPFAFNKVTGQFSEQQFVDFLARQGLTPRDAEAELKDQLTQRHFQIAAQNSFKIPNSLAALDAVTGLQNRDVSYFTLAATSMPQPPAPSDAQLTAFMREHAQQLTRPEMRIITVALFSAKAMAPTVKVDPAEVQKEFNFKKDTLSTPERRTIIQIPVRSAAQASEASARLSKGDAPDAIAKSFGGEAVNYPDTPQSAIPDRKVAAAAFALPTGQVSGPVQGDLGMAVLKVVKVTPATVANFEAARPGIEADVRTHAAQNQAYALSQKFDDARQAGSSVVDAARKAGVAVLTVGPVTSTGVDADGKPVAVLTPQALKSAFARAQGEDGDLEDAGAGEYFAVHVDRVLPPSLPPLDEKRAILTQAYVHEQLVKALRARADTIIAQIHKGATMDQAAAQAGAHVVHQAGMQRILVRQYKGLGDEFLQGVFTGKAGEAFAAGAENGVNIVRVDAIRPADTLATAHAIQSIAPRLTQDYFEEVMSAVRHGARNQVRVAINLALARQTLGVDPSAVKGDDAKSASKAK